MKTAVVTGGGRGVGASIAQALAADGWDVVVTARTRAQIDAVAREIGGRAVAMDVADDDSVQQGFEEIGSVDLLVANAGVGDDDFRVTFEVNFFGVQRCVEAALRRGVSRIVVTTSQAAFIPPNARISVAYSASKAAVSRYAETLDATLEVPVFQFTPGLVRTEMTDGVFPDEAPWSPPELAGELVRQLATGQYDALSGRFLRAPADDLDDLLARADEIRERDRNAIRLQR